MNGYCLEPNKCLFYEKDGTNPKKTADCLYAVYGDCFLPKHKNDE